MYNVLDSTNCLGRTEYVRCSLCISYANTFLVNSSGVFAYCPAASLITVSTPDSLRLDTGYHMRRSSVSLPQLFLNTFDNVTCLRV